MGIYHGLNVTPEREPQPADPIGSGAKHDGGKPRFDLLRFGCPNSLEGVAKVLTFGAKKYADHSWQTVEHGVTRYWSAMERHMNAIAKGEERDEESGELHVDHIACNALFLGELLREQYDEAK